MPALRTYRVFISHAWHRSGEYYRVEQFLDDAPNFYWENLSVPEHDPVDSEELERELRNQMRPVDVFVIIGGMYTKHSDWIDFELNFARRIGKPVILIAPWGSQRLPVFLQNAATETVNWNSASIVRAIRSNAHPTGVRK
jgi:hypothetical protein